MYAQTPFGGIMGDNPFTPNLSLKKQTSAGGVKQKIVQEGSSAHYFDQGWDQSGTGDGNYKSTYSNRGQYYLGHTKSESDK